MKAISIVCFFFVLLVGCASTSEISSTGNMDSNNRYNGEEVILKVKTWHSEFILTEQAFYEVSRREDQTYDTLFSCEYSQTAVTRYSGIPALSIWLSICGKSFRFGGLVGGKGTMMKVYETIHAQEKKIAAIRAQKKEDTCSKRKMDIQGRAGTGDADAQFELGAWYLSSCGDYYVASRADRREKAAEWYRRAAKQGHVTANRFLGSMYLEGKGVKKDVDEAEKWYRRAAQQGDTVSQRQLDRLITEKTDKAAARLLLEKHAQQAKARFDSIVVTVAEKEETKRLRAEAPSALKTFGEGVGDVTLGAAGGAGAGALGAGFVWLGPAGAAVGAVLGIAGGIDRARKSAKEKAKIKEAVLDLNKVLAEENVEQVLQTQLLDLAEQQQAGDFLIANPSGITPSALHIDIEEIGVFKVWGDRVDGRLWLAAAAKLVNTKQDTEPIKNRVCYGSARSTSLTSWSANNGEKFREDLTAAYRFLSNQILSEMVGLAPDPDITGIWDRTAEACAAKLENVLQDFTLSGSIPKDEKILYNPKAVPANADCHTNSSGGKLYITDRATYFVPRENVSHAKVWNYRENPIEASHQGGPGLGNCMKITDDTGRSYIYHIVYGAKKASRLIMEQMKSAQGE